MPRRYTIEDLQEYASRSGGKCLSKEYIDLRAPLKWRCAHGHSWDADFAIIKQGGWCAICSRKNYNEEKLEEIKLIANERGGQCLSNKYINCREKLKFRCCEGHTWLAPSHRFLNGQWCLKCIIKKRRDTGLEAVKLAAKKKGGECLANKYIDTETKIKFKCSDGHTWMMNGHSIKSGNWCPKCAINSRVEKRKTKIEVYQKYALQKGGKLLSEKYITGHKKLLWQCHKGHEWSATGIMVINSETWCPYCQGMYRNIKDMQLFADKRGGKCLSKKYVNSKTKLKWQCSNGHIWSSAPCNIVNNCWCPVCGLEIAKSRQTDGIEKYQALATKKGGKLLSVNYVNNRTPLIWQCKQGHQWKAMPANIFHLNSWCPHCFDIAQGRKPRSTNIFKC